MEAREEGIFTIGVEGHFVCRARMERMASASRMESKAVDRGETIERAR
jgi:hypothetical protein